MIVPQCTCYYFINIHLYYDHGHCSLYSYYIFHHSSISTSYPLCLCQSRLKKYIFSKLIKNCIFRQTYSMFINIIIYEILCSSYLQDLYQKQTYVLFLFVNSLSSQISSMEKQGQFLAEFSSVSTSIPFIM